MLMKKGEEDKKYRRFSRSQEISSDCLTVYEKTYDISVLTHAVSN